QTRVGEDQPLPLHLALAEDGIDPPIILERQRYLGAQAEARQAADEIVTARGLDFEQQSVVPFRQEEIVEIFALRCEEGAIARAGLFDIGADQALQKGAAVFTGNRDQGASRER